MRWAGGSLRVAALAGAAMGRERSKGCQVQGFPFTYLAHLLFQSLRRPQRRRPVRRVQGVLHLRPLLENDRSRISLPTITELHVVNASGLCADIQAHALFTKDQRRPLCKLPLFSGRS